MQNLLHLLRFGDYLVISGAATNLASQILDFVFQAAGLERVTDGDCKLVEVERFADEIIGAKFQCPLHIVKLRVGGDHDDCSSAVVLLDVLKDVEPAHVRKSDVEQYEIGQLVVSGAYAARAIWGLHYGIAPFLALLAKRPANKLFVVDD
jgi:hypothetical protein